MFKKILIANRGEIACRIARTARRMGIQTVAIFSDADRSSLHVTACDEAIHIGGNTPGESYLLADKIVAAALSTGAEAIHPGFGFLSENARFAETCTENNIVFIGPSPEVIRSMGSKSAARQLMQKADVPVLPGYDAADQDAAALLEIADTVGFPLLIKAVAGGGGKGLRAVNQKADFPDALNAVKRESLGAFGDDAVLLERYLPVARHIEIQIFADSHGNVVHLFERDCSLQRRHQKVIEEAPAMGISPDLRADFAEAAVSCSQAIGYLGAGTVEFLLAPDNTFYFMEMNTRLQVEHPVTEMITGQDLVEWQFRVAAGQPLPVSQAELCINGHAIEARIYAENPERDFLPSIGRLDYLQPPTPSSSIRIDTGVTEGDEISAHYDPMIAKLICWGQNRTESLSKLNAALKQYNLIGPHSNIRFLAGLCEHPAMIDGGTDTLFIEHHIDELLEPEKTAAPHALIAASLSLLQSRSRHTSANQQLTTDPHSPWADSDNWRVSETATPAFTFQSGSEISQVALTPAPKGERAHEHQQITISGKTHTVETTASTAPQINLVIDGQLTRAIVIHSDNMLRVLINTITTTLKLITPGQTQTNTAQQKGQLTSPMPGKIIACPAESEQYVSQGETLMVVEAMKMEHAILAPQDGQIAAVHFTTGDQVEEGDTLLTFTP